MVVCDNDDDVLFLGEKQHKRRAHKNTGDTYEMMDDFEEEEEEEEAREGRSVVFI